MIVCVFVVMMLQSRPKEMVFPFCGKVMQIQPGHFVLSDGRKQATIFMEHDYVYDQKLCVEGAFKKQPSRSNFVKDPIENWRISNQHVDVIDPSLVVLTSDRLSFKGRLYRNLIDQPHTDWIIRLLYTRKLEQSNMFSMLFLSSGMQFVYALALIRKRMRMFFYPTSVNVGILVFWILFGMIWGTSLIWWRVLLTTVALPFFKDRKSVFAISYGILMIMFPYAYDQLSLVFPMLLHGISLHHKTTWWQRSLFVGLIQQTFLYHSNWLLILGFGFFRQISGISYFLAWIATLFVPFRIVFHNMMESTLTWDPPKWLVLTQINFKLPFFLFIVLCFLFFALRYRPKGPMIGCIFLIIAVTFVVFPMYDMVIFFNVGQADAILIRGRFNRANIMIDTGRRSNGMMLVRSLKAMGVQHLDAVFLSHPHEDHIGGHPVIIQHIPMLLTISDKTDHRFAHVKVQTLNKEYIGIHENDDSLIHFIEIQGLRYLFTGDVYHDGERALIRQYPHLDVDILKVAHHGSKTSSFEEFLATTQPLIGIISSDPVVYGHPHAVTMRTLFQHHVIPMLTHEEGDIVIISIFGNHFLLSSTGRFGIIKTVIP